MNLSGNGKSPFSLLPSDLRHLTPGNYTPLFAANFAEKGKVSVIY